MKNSVQPVFDKRNRRSFLKQSVVAAGAATMSAGLLNAPGSFAGQEDDGSNGSLTKGDAAMLRFLQVLETMQGGSSLYPSLAQRVHSPEVLRILLSIGPTETSHFQTWHDKAGNAPNITDGDLSFPNLNGSNDPKVADMFQTNLIMPEATFFLSRKLPTISIIRPTETEGAAMGAVQAFIDDGLFRGHIVNGKSDGFIELLKDLAEDADEARR
jgi:hypothetical protein